MSSTYATINLTGYNQLQFEGNTNYTKPESVL